ncbi:hypothetical protein L484_013248 [Morus notabilis]|uniref:Uncharacterized protein n=1 Tax=Morus notabilis TaxID=981085 RepID=W9S3U1_9ROSA|nr:hypothetical protein L484_013248 [Morus notabilis]
MSASSEKWQWENATAGAVAGFATVAAMHPLDVVRTRFQVNDGRVSNIPTYKNTANAIFTIARSEARLERALRRIFSCSSWVDSFMGYDRAKQRYSRNRAEKLSPGHHLASAAEAGALVCLCTNPIWLVKTRLQLQNPLHQTRPYSGFYVISFGKCFPFEHRNFSFMKTTSHWIRSRSNFDEILFRRLNLVNNHLSSSMKLWDVANNKCAN